MQRLEIKPLRGEIFYDHPLAEYTSWHVGGPAQCLYIPADLADLRQFLAQTPQDIPLTWLGLGSNLLIRDGGLPGITILTLNRLKDLTALPDHKIYAQAGVTCAKVAKFCVKEGFDEGAFFAGIPGTVGGALAMNAGAFGGETWEYVTAVETIDRQGKIYQRTPAEFNVEYRHVTKPAEEYFIAGTFQFNPGNSVEAKARISALLKRRNETQPIGERSCGSVFRNPPNDHAARLIEAAGLKGLAIGGAQVSLKHANFFINTGTATAHDLERLIEQVAQTVEQKFGVKLIKEVHIIGNKA